jgi:hypothetical protein
MDNHLPEFTEQVLLAEVEDHPFFACESGSISKAALS